MAYVLLTSTSDPSSDLTPSNVPITLWGALLLWRAWSKIWNTAYEKLETFVFHFLFIWWQQEKISQKQDIITSSFSSEDRDLYKRTWTWTTTLVGKEAETLPEPTIVLGLGTKKKDSLIINRFCILWSTNIQQKVEGLMLFGDTRGRWEKRWEEKGLSLRNLGGWCENFFVVS